MGLHFSLSPLAGRRVGVRGRFHKLGLAERPPHPPSLRSVDLSPQAGRGKVAATQTSPKHALALSAYATPTSPLPPRHGQSGKTHPSPIRPTTRNVQKSDARSWRLPPVEGARVRSYKFLRASADTSTPIS